MRGKTNNRFDMSVVITCSADETQEYFEDHQEPKLQIFAHKI